jgi:hypothetical protein
MRNMNSRAADEVALAVHTKVEPSDAEWKDWLAVVRQIPLEKLSVLVFTDGGGPNTLQRASWNALLAGAQPRIAVVSTSTVVRGIVTAISWFNRGVRQFSPGDTVTAFRHVGVDGRNAEHMLAEANQLALHLAGGRPESLPPTLP